MTDDSEHFANITIKPLIVANDQLKEFISFLAEAMTILDVSPALREVLEEWCDEHDA